MNKYKKGKICINWLDFNDMINLLKEYKKNEDITRVLAQQLKICIIKEKILLEYYNFNYVVTTIDDNDIERCCVYKTVLSKRTMFTNENYHALAYQFYLETEKKYYYKYEKNFTKGHNIMMKILEHKEFMNLQPRLVVMFIKIYANLPQILTALLQHPMFKK